MDPAEEEPDKSGKSTETDRPTDGAPSQSSKAQDADVALAEADVARYFLPWCGCIECYLHGIDLKEATLLVISAERDAKYHRAHLRSNCSDLLLSITADVNLLNAEYKLRTLASKANQHSAMHLAEMKSMWTQKVIDCQLQAIGDELALFRWADSRRGYNFR
ncbi:hypothetical protein GGH94_004100 [Coemansia aciculifera]|uniref:Uncharacterized protein n=1 Tax=Coemansia aciculifera TaxID=417176 RepID=A0A9W8IL08_9FUNG|nr:hypothetical protein GGH94_004100 [Coemansia aciculifera]KAJ2872940.1 hypothetical protein GGH93_003609 [Coemansia aciculifera]